MTERTCTFNEKGICTAPTEFPEMKEKPCRFSDDGLCTAEEKDLIKICPECSFGYHKQGECDENDEATLWVPKSISVCEEERK